MDPTLAPAPGRARSLTALALALLTPALVLLTRSAQQTGDALLYAWSIRTGQDLFHPHHLLYAPAVRALYLALAPAMPSGFDALAAAQVHGAAWATVAVVFLFLALDRAVGRTGPAVLGAVALLVSQGFWMLSTHANPYVPAVGCLCVVLERLIRAGGTGRRAGPWVAASLAWALAVLYHQVNVLLALPIAVYAWTATGRGQRRAALAAALVPASTIVLGAYAAVVGLGSTGTAGDGFFDYALEYARHPNPTWGTLANLGPSGIAALMTGQTWSLVALHRTLRPAVVVTVCLAIAALAAWHATRLRRGVALGPLRRFLLLWIGVDLAFFLWWLPQHTPFFLLTAVPVLALGAIALAEATAGRPGRLRGTAVTAVAVAAVATFHLLVVILPLHALHRPAFDEARALDRLVDRGCYVLAPYEVAQSLRYYFDRPRSAHARFPLLCVYRGEPIPEPFALRENECVVVALDYLRPDWSLWGYDGYTRPRRWLDWLDRILDLRTGPDGGVVACREFRALATGTGAGYLAVAPRLRRVSGLAQVLAELDDAVAATSGGSDRPFARWRAEAGAGIAGPAGGAP